MIDGWQTEDANKQTQTEDAKALVHAADMCTV